MQMEVRWMEKDMEATDIRMTETHIWSKSSSRSGFPTEKLGNNGLEDKVKDTGFRVKPGMTDQ